MKVHLAVPGWYAYSTQTLLFHSEWTRGGEVGDGGVCVSGIRMEEEIKEKRQRALVLSVNDKSQKLPHDPPV